MEHVIELTNVSKHYRNFSLRGIDLKVKRGFITGFVGPNGAGKSTTIRCIMNLIQPDDGEVKIFGKQHDEETAEIKQRIGFIHDANIFYEHLSLQQNKRLIAPFYKHWNEDRFQYLMARFELPAWSKVGQLSKGMKLKFSMAVALAHDPDLIIMDEPTSGLDPLFRREFLELLQEIIQDEQKTVFFSTHLTSDLEKIADYVTFIHDGQIVWSEEKHQILEQYALVKGSRTWLTAERRSKLRGVRETDFGFEALLTDRQLLVNDTSEQVILEKPTLEDIIFYTVKEHRNGHATST